MNVAVKISSTAAASHYMADYNERRRHYNLENQAPSLSTRHSSGIVRADFLIEQYDLRDTLSGIPPLLYANRLQSDRFVYVQLDP